MTLDITDVLLVSLASAREQLKLSICILSGHRRIKIPDFVCVTSRGLDGEGADDEDEDEEDKDDITKMTKMVEITTKAEKMM